MRIAASGTQRIFPVSHIDLKERKALGSVKTILLVPLTGCTLTQLLCCCVYIDWLLYLLQSMGQFMGQSSPNCTNDM